jgi:Fur family iron response transcriptional regulator
MPADRTRRRTSAQPPRAGAARQPVAGPRLCGAAADCPQVARKLMQAGIAPTAQRRALGALLLCAPVHVTAEQVLRAAQAQALPVSRATVYNTLHLFTERGLLRELPITGVETVYDSTTTPHHHFYDLASGEVSDIDCATLQVTGLDALAADWDIDSVETVVRGRRKQPAAA